MKANAPEKLYIFNPEKREVWFSKTSDKQVEYTRTDALIEKACFWLENHYRDYMHNPTGKKLEAFFGMDMITDLKQAMKDEYDRH